MRAPELGSISDCDQSGEFAGRVVVITGGGAGFGEAFARAFSVRGALVALLDIDIGSATRVADEIKSHGGQAIAIECDVSDESAVDAAADQVCEELGGVDVLINNAAMHLSRYNQPFGSLPRGELRQMFNVNVMGIVNCCLAFRDGLSSRQGVIVNLSSIAGHFGVTPYGVSKLAVRGLTTAFAREFSEAGIRVNCISPGLVATPSALGDQPPEKFADFADRLQTVRRRGEMEDVVSAALFLCSNASSFVSGEVLKVSGGYPLEV